MPMMGSGSAVPNKIPSNPPPDGKKVINIYVNKDGKLVIVYENEEA